MDQFVVEAKEEVLRNQGQLLMDEYHVEIRAKQGSIADELLFNQQFLQCFQKSDVAFLAKMKDEGDIGVHVLVIFHQRNNAVDPSIGFFGRKSLPRVVPAEVRQIEPELGKTFQNRYPSGRVVEKQTLFRFVPERDRKKVVHFLPIRIVPAVRQFEGVGQGSGAVSAAMRGYGYAQCLALFKNLHEPWMIGQIAQQRVNFHTEESIFLAECFLENRIHVRVVRIQCHKRQKTIRKSVSGLTHGIQLMVHVVHVSLPESLRHVHHQRAHNKIVVRLTHQFGCDIDQTFLTRHIHKVGGVLGPRIVVLLTTLQDADEPPKDVSLHQPGQPQVKIIVGDVISVEEVAMDVETCVGVRELRHHFLRKVLYGGP